MSLQRQLAFWAAGLAALVLALWLLAGILVPFLAGIALAYFLDPVADALERLGLPRLAAVLVILGSFLCLFVLVLILVIPVLGDQLGRLVDALPGYVAALVRLVNDIAPDWLLEALAKPGAGEGGALSDVAGRAAGWVTALLASLWSGGMALVNLASLMIVTPIVAFYMLNDWDRMLAHLDALLPRDHAETIRGLAREIDAAVAGFIRGQGSVCLVLGIAYALALSWVGLSYGLLIGLGAGLVGFIPYIGAIFGGLVALATALVQFWPDWTRLLMVAAVFVAGQVIENNFLVPKLVGERIGLHPVWMMFALFAFGYLFGIAGVLVAVPLAAAVGVLVRFAIRRYRESVLYLGSGAGAAARGTARERRRR